MGITKIDCFQSDAKTVGTVILRLKDVADSKILNITGSTAADRRLFLGCYAGKKFLKFLVKYAGNGEEQIDYANEITDESKFTKLVDGIVPDWDTRPLEAKAKIQHFPNSEKNMSGVQRMLPAVRGRPVSGRRLAGRMASYKGQEFLRSSV